MLGLLEQGNSGNSWSYDDITLDAEHRIRQLISAAEAKDDDASARRFRYMAYGVFVMWDSLTLGWRSSIEAQGHRDHLLRLIGPYDLQWREELGLAADQ